MREIKFRGKPTERFVPNLELADYLRERFEYDGKFVYGSLVKDKEGRTYIISSCQASSNVLLNNAIGTAIEVIPSTIGQFTGLLDKNGKEGYEGDIAKVKWLADIGITELDLEADGVIKYDVDTARFLIHLIKPIRTGVCEDGIYEEEWLPLLKHEEDMNYEWEVIGNIHEVKHENG